MKLTLVIDTNGQRSEHIPATARLILLHKSAEVVLVGERSCEARWYTGLQRWVEPTVSITRVPVVAWRDAATVTMAMILERMRATASATCDKDTRWVVVSRRVGFRAATESLLASGLNAKYLPAITQSEIDALVASSKSAGDGLRALAKRMAGERDKRIRISEFANMATAMMPELASPARREELFGFRRFKAVCNAVGIETEGEFLKVHIRKRSAGRLAR